MVLLPLAMQAVYFAWMHASARQATLGKMAVGIKVTDEDGQAISFARGIAATSPASSAASSCASATSLAGFTDRKRALHDMIVGTWSSTNGPSPPTPERQRHELGTVTLVIVVIAGVLVIGYFLLIAALVAMGVASGSS
jgi:uncharacterized RDD family membrane protein YckC